jgi:protein with PEP-CTERM/exosortase system signal
VIAIPVRLLVKTSREANGRQAVLPAFLGHQTTKAMKKPVILVLLGAALIAARADAQLFSFTTGAPDGRLATGSRPGNPSFAQIEIESADDFILSSPTQLTSATFTGLIPAGVSLSSVGEVQVEIYRVFPLDSTNPPSGMVPTRANSPSDNAFDFRNSLSGGGLSFTSSILNPTFTAANSILNGINKSPNQTTGGEGPVTGQEVQFTVTFTNPLNLPADHYFFVPQVGLSSGDFLWLSTAEPPLFTGDLQAWIRNANLDPDWLREGTDIVGGNPAPKFNEAFSLNGTVPDSGSTALLLGSAAVVVFYLRRRVAA